MRTVDLCIANVNSASSISSIFDPRKSFYGDNLCACVRSSGENSLVRACKFFHHITIMFDSVSELNEQWCLIQFIIINCARHWVGSYPIMCSYQLSIHWLNIWSYHIFCIKFTPHGFSIILHITEFHLMKYSALFFNSSKSIIIF